MIKENTKRIEIKNLSKSFHADFKKSESFILYLSNILKFKKEKKEIIIAKDISFDVHSGEILGIVGKNGAGKSSLLRLIAGIYAKDSGSIKINGKIVYLTGASQGSVPKLTMRENIFLMGSVLGLGQKDIKNKFDEIVEFSGLKEYVDMKIYQFSTGMVSRLNFSILMHCVKHHSPDILLIDEVLSAGGDADFQEKATKKMEELIQGGSAVILISHDMNTLEKYCDNVLWINEGKIIEKGKPDFVIKKYLDFMI